MTPEEAEFTAGLCASRAGLNVDPRQAYLLESRLAPVARRENFASLPDFLRAVRDRGEERMVWALVEALSSAPADFFIDPAMFQTLAQEAAARARRQAVPLRIWVAACGAGQEAYSVIMALQEASVDGVIELVASDLSERRLEKARTGLFSQFEVQRGLSAHRLIRHFEKTDESFQIGGGLRQAIDWRRINLVEGASGLGRFDIILCRHLLKTMTPQGRASAVRVLDEALAPGGWLVLDAEDAAKGLAPVSGRPGVYIKAGGLSAAAA